MQLKTTFTILDRNLRDLDLAKKDYPTIADLMKEQNVSNNHNEYWKNECELNPSNLSCHIYEY